MGVSTGQFIIGRGSKSIDHYSFPRRRGSSYPACVILCRCIYYIDPCPCMPPCQWTIARGIASRILNGQPLSVLNSGLARFVCLTLLTMKLSSSKLSVRERREFETPCIRRELITVSIISQSHFTDWCHPPACMPNNQTCRRAR